MLNATTTAGAQLRNLVIIVICIALLAGINVVFNDYIVRVISTIFIFMILAVSYNLINGVTGQLSLEPNGFVAVGAYVTALLILSSDSKVDMFEMAAPSPWILSLHAGFLPALLISGLCAAALAVCLAVPVFRVRGDYLAIVTLGFGFIIKILAINNPQITNGAIGLNDIPQQPHLLFWCGLFALLATPLMTVMGVWSQLLGGSDYLQQELIDALAVQDSSVLNHVPSIADYPPQPGYPSAGHPGDAAAGSGVHADAVAAAPAVSRLSAGHAVHLQPDPPLPVDRPAALCQFRHQNHHHPAAGPSAHPAWPRAARPDKNRFIGLPVAAGWAYRVGAGAGDARGQAAGR